MTTITDPEALPSGRETVHMPPGVGNGSALAGGYHVRRYQ